jgi:hypothetical protein
MWVHNRMKLSDAVTNQLSNWYYVAEWSANAILSYYAALVIKNIQSFLLFQKKNFNSLLKLSSLEAWQDE